MNQVTYNFIRYLEAKKSVDDRAINRHVWQVLSESLPKTSPEKPLRIVEMGAGIGTMIERMIEWDLLDYANYTAIDAQPENIQHAQQRLLNWSSDHDYQAVELADGLKIIADGIELSVNLIDVDLFDFLSDQRNLNSFDLLVAHAFLDLMDLPATLSQIFRLGQDGCLFYFTVNYDGLTILKPVIDNDFDKHVMKLYHRTMRERIHNGKQFGDSQAGRHLFDQIQDSGGRILAAGSSDWFVFPNSSGYYQDEAFFLHYIIHTIYRALRDKPELDLEQFEQWIRQRHAQIDKKELVYIAHQLDYVGEIQRN